MSVTEELRSVIYSLLQENSSTCRSVREKIRPACKVSDKYHSFALRQKTVTKSCTSTTINLLPVRSIMRNISPYFAKYNWTHLKQWRRHTRVCQAGASIPPETMMHFPLCFRFPPYFRKIFVLSEKF